MESPAYCRELDERPKDVAERLRVLLASLEHENNANEGRMSESG
jgi:hypothetical protein